MFYVKTQLNNDAAIEVDIIPENVFCRCPRCNREVSVDLVELARDEEFDLEGCAVLCDDCGEELIARKLMEVDD